MNVRLFNVFYIILKVTDIYIFQCANVAKKGKTLLLITEVRISGLGDACHNRSEIHNSYKAYILLLL